MNLKVHVLVKWEELYSLEHSEDIQLVYIHSFDVLHTQYHTCTSLHHTATVSVVFMKCSHPSEEILHSFLKSFQFMITDDVSEGPIEELDREGRYLHF